VAEDTWRGALEGREDLKKYGNNAVLLFALALHQDIDDIELVANDALTDSRNDKKCDLVYVSPERGKIIIAQGYWSERDDRASAPANKASDLNTAVSWLLGGDLAGLPENLRNAADQVRESIASNEISSIDIWYVHNLPESSNVSDELERVTATCDSLAKRLYPESTIENIRGLEVGKNTLDTWYRGTKAPILVTDTFEFETTGGFTSQGSNWSAYSTSVKASWLRDMFDNHGRDLFSANVRDYLGSRRSDKNINNNIKVTAKEQPDMFWVYNNGITALVNDFSFTSEDNSGILEIHGIAIVNGAQTTGALGTIEGADIEGATVTARFVKCSDPATIQSIIRFNNSQNKIEAADFRSNDPVQTRLRSEFDGLPNVHYTGGRRGGEGDAIRRTRNSVSSYTVGQALTAFHGDPSTAYNQSSGIWISDRLYNDVFNEKTTAKHILFTYSLLKAINEWQDQLRNLGADGRTEVEKRQWETLRLRGAPFLVISAIASSLEVVLSRPVPDKFSLTFSRTEDISQAVVHWSNLLKIMLPFTSRLAPALTQSNLKNKTKVSSAINDFVDILSSVKDSHAETFDSFKQQLD
jgi:hypothetical protein